MPTLPGNPENKTYDPLFDDRLIKLATHLESGKLWHDVFDFSVYHSIQPSCKTAGCAIGECPAVFPSEWVLSNKTSPVLRGYENKNTPVFLSAMDFFNLHRDQFEMLFVPNSKATSSYTDLGLIPLLARATREEVAANLRAFVKWRKKQYGK